MRARTLSAFYMCNFRCLGYWVNADEMPKDEDEELQAALAASLENIKEPIKTTSEDGKTDTSKEEETFARKIPAYPPLPEEPKGDRSLLCRVGVRLPDGRRVQRNFLRTDPIQVDKNFYYLRKKMLDFLHNALKPFLFMLLLEILQCARIL